jgi:phosphatidylethanolamine/phosphatidyl-N-methylethanolamine N-methyltransferase
MNSADIDRIEVEKNFWNRYAGKYDHFMKRLAKTYSLITDLIREDLNPGDHVLEIAAGTGLITLEIASQVKKVDAIDISEHMINIASRKARDRGIRNIHFSVKDSYSLDYPDNTFDACIVANTLHVMKEPERALSEAKRTLKADGILIAPTYCHGESIKTRLISRIMSFSGFNAHHKFSTVSFDEFIGRNGLIIVKRRIIKDVVPLSYVVARQV